MSASAVKWWQSGVVYQIYPRSFQDSNGDGVGDLNGIISRLDYLKDLGIGVIWISPFYRSPMKDFGYDVADYCDVDPLFGTLADFDRLVQEAHARDIKVIIDWVPNHTSDQHAWFLESRASRTNPKRNWYHWRDPKPNGDLPNNWGSMFGGPAWKWDETTQQYYFHQFVPEQPDLNWHNPEVRAAMYDVLRFWLRRGVDGFRMDVVNMIIKHPDMPDQPVVAGATGRGADDIFGRQEHPYDQDYDGIHTVMREIRAVLDEFGDTLAVGEIWLPLDRWKHYYGTPEQPEIHLPFNFRLILQDLQWTAETLRREVALIEQAVPAHGYPNYVLNNHDNSRFPSRMSAPQARNAAMLLMTLRGTPTIYYGEELGMVDGDIQPHQMQDPQGINLGIKYSRDVCRTPMQWDASPYAGFSTVEPWLPVGADYGTRNTEAQRQDPQSMFALYRALIHLRRESATLIVGSYQDVPAPQDIFAFTRTHNGETFLIVLNISDQTVKMPYSGHGKIVLDTNLERVGEPFADEIVLTGDEGVIISLN